MKWKNIKSWSVSITSNLIAKKEVWTLITDIDNWKEWDFNIDHSECTESKAGQRFLFKVKHHSYFITATGVVEQFIPYERFEFRIQLAGARMYRTYLMEDVEQGLKMTIITSISGLFAELWSFLVVKRIVKDTPEDLTIIVEQIREKYEKKCAF